MITTVSSFSPLAILRGMWELSSPNQGSNPSLLHWKLRVLTPGHQGNPPTVSLVNMHHRM